MENQPKSNVTCPDCNLYKLHTKKELSDNRCIQCSRRKLSCTTLRTSRGLEELPYKPIKDCTYEEYKLFYDKFINSKDNKPKSNLELYNKRETHTTEFREWLRGYAKDHTVTEIKLKIQELYPEYEKLWKDIPKGALYRYMIQNNITYKKMPINVKNTDTQKRIDTVRSVCRGDLTVSDIMLILRTVYPKLEITEPQVRNYIIRYNLPYKQANKSTNNKAEYSDRFIDYLKLNCSDLTPEEIRVLIKDNFPEYKNLYEGKYCSQALNRLLKTREIEYKGIQPKETTRKDIIYDEEVITTIKRLARPDKTVRELVSELNELFPHKNISNKNIYEPLRKNKIPYAASDVHGRPVKKLDETDNIELLEVDDYKVETVKIKSEKVHLIEPQPVEDRYKPIKEEIEATAKTKFKQLNCDIDLNLTTNDYLDCLKSIRYLCGNIHTIETNRLNQHDVMTNFDDDVTHAIENEEPQPGDTYLMDKLKIVRNMRRYYEYDMEDMAIMKAFINSIDIKKLDMAIAKLDEVSKSRKEAVYIPTVDMSMIDKYDWAVKGNINSEKINKPILKSTTAKNNYSKTKKFRATCQISGGKYGVFQTWIKDYMCDSQEEALINAKKELAAIIRQNRGGVHYINLTAHQINI